MKIFLIISGITSFSIEFLIKLIKSIYLSNSRVGNSFIIVINRISYPHL